MFVGNRHVGALTTEAPFPADADLADSTQSVVPLVSIIIPARNEERNLAEALQSVLAQDYPRLEFIAVNDRSTDGTGAILRDIASRDPRLRVVEITELPGGWLGKNYALALGASRAAGDLLLFTDADVIMAPSVIRRAVGFLRRRATAHIAISPRFLNPSPALRMFLGAFVVFFGLYAKPWRVHRPRSGAHIGIGAFNLLTRDAYERIGTHRAICMRPDDDMKLGKLIKLYGLRQAFMQGGDLLQVEWYASLRELVAGLMKNAFAGVDYNPLRVVVATFAVFVFIFWPLVALFFTTGATWWLNVASAALLALNYLLVVPHAGIARRYVFFFPLGALLMLYIIWRAMFLTYKHNGIHWRDTHYPLKHLRANKL
jgi:glycosyltransferase involved in cell wall biosynthesis